MKKRSIRQVFSLAVPVIAVLAMLLSVLLPAAVPASAAASLRLSRGTVAPNEPVTVVGYGFSPGSAIVYTDFNVQGSTHRLQTATTVAGNGTFSATFTVPAGTRPGVYRVTAQDFRRNTATQDLTVLAAVPETINQQTPSVTLAAGHYFYVYGTGYLPNETVTVTASFPLYNGNTYTENKTFRVDAHGQFADLLLQVPADAQMTNVTLTAQAQLSGRRAQAVLAVRYFPWLSLSSTSLAPGGSVTVNGHGYIPGSAVHVSVTVPRSGAATITLTKTVTAGGNGAFSTGFALPSDVNPGSYAFAATDTVGNLIAHTAFTVGVKPTIALQPASLSPGGTTTVTGSGFTPNANVTLTAVFPLYGGGSRTVTFSVHTNGNGAFATHLATPGNAAAGAVTVTAHGPNGLAHIGLQVGHVGVRVAVAPAAAVPGSHITVTGSGYPAGDHVAISMTVHLTNGATTTLTGTAIASNSGQFSFVLAVPANVANGNYSIVARSTATGRAPIAHLSVAMRPTIALQPASLSPGGTTTVTGAGFTANATITLTAVFPLYGGGSKTISFNLQTNGNGAFAIHLATPGNAAAGAVTVTARGPNGLAHVGLQVGHVSAAVSVSPASVIPGSRVTVTGSGYPAGDHIAISMTVHLTNGTTTTLTGTGVANSQGRFAVPFSIPANVASGNYNLAARSAATGRTPVTHLVIAHLAPSVVAVPSSAVPGSQLTVNGFGFAPGQQVSIYLNGQKVGTAGTNGSGRFSVGITVPHGLASGAYTLQGQSADGRKSGPFTLTVNRQVSTHFYFASEYTGTGYHEYLAFLNPTATRARVTITYQRTNGSTLTKSFNLNPYTRSTEDVNADLGFHVSAAAVVAADVPIVATRFVTHYSDGAVVPGETHLGTTWYFANGNTGHGYREYIAVQNPNNDPVQVALHFFPSHHRAFTVYKTMLPTSRTTFKVNSYVHKDAVGVTVTANGPVVANRTIFIHHGMTSKMGVSAPQTSWYFAAGPSNLAARNWIGAINPSGRQAYITLRAIGPYGGTRATIHAWLRPNARVGYLMNKIAHTPDVAVILQSSAPIVAEQTTYNGNLHNASTDTFGVANAAKSWEFALANTQAGENDMLALFNPNNVEVPIVVQFLNTSGQRIERTYVVGPLSQQHVSVGSVMPNAQAGIVAASNYPFVALNRYTFNNGLGADTSIGTAG